jgi:hypothetical protein
LLQTGGPAGANLSCNLFLDAIHPQKLTFTIAAERHPVCRNAIFINKNGPGGASYLSLQTGGPAGAILSYNLFLHAIHPQNLTFTIAAERHPVCSNATFINKNGPGGASYLSL